MDRYKYSVTPFSPIKELIPGQSIRAPFSADLNKDEVFICMKHGPVYRLFPGKDPIRVTGSNFESLHKAKFEEEKEEPVKTVAAPVNVDNLKIGETPFFAEKPPVKDVKIFDKEEIKETYSVEESAPEEIEEESIEEEVEEEYAEDVIETAEEPVKVSEETFEEDEEPVEEDEESEEEGLEEEVETQVESENHVSSPKFNPQYKPNYSKKKKNRNRNSNNNN